MNTLYRFLTPLIAATIATSGTMLSHASADSGNSPGGAFSTQDLNGWTERSFQGNTRYELVTEGGVPVLKGHTQGQASVLYREQKIDLLKTPMINWSWKVDRTYSGIDEQVREGDDFPARLYVVAKIGFLPWESLAINYVWASDVPPGTTWANPFSNKAIMVAVQSGDADVGTWSIHTRNVAEDFKTLFNRDITEIDGYAVMVDGDNSNVEATAWFGEINFSSVPP